MKLLSAALFAVFCHLDAAEAADVGMGLLGCYDCYNFGAPSILGAENLPSPQIGQIVYDTATKRFRGYNQMGLWTTLSAEKVSSVHTTPGAIAASEEIVTVDSSLYGAMTLTLPPAASLAGREIMIIKKKTDTLNYVITLAGSGGDTVDGGTARISTAGESRRLISTGSGWVTIGHEASSAWDYYVPTLTGFGSVGPMNAGCQWRREGPDLLLRCSFTSGTSTATEARLSLPSGLTMAYTILGAVGTWSNGTVGNGLHPVLVVDVGMTYVTFGLANSASGSVAKQNGSALLSAGQVMSIQDIRVPIAEWAD